MTGIEDPREREISLIKVLQSLQGACVAVNGTTTAMASSMDVCFTAIERRVD